MKYAMKSSKRLSASKLLLVPALLALLALTACGGGASNSNKATLDNTEERPTNSNIKERTPTPDDIEEIPGTNIKYVSKELLVLAKDGVSESSIESTISQYSGNIVGYIKDVGIYQVRFNNVTDLSELAIIAEALDQDDNVDVAALNIVLDALNYADTVDAPAFFDCSDNNPTIEYEGKHYGYYTFHCNSKDDIIKWNEAVPGYKNWGLEATKAISAWKYLNEIDDITSINVGIIDKGILEHHEDLPEIKNITWNHTDSLSEDEDEYKKANHGTMIASIISGVHHNHIGVAGVFPAKHIYFKKHFSVIWAIGDMLDNGVKVINVSLGAKECTTNENLSGRRDLLLSSAARIMERYLKIKIRTGSDFVIVAAAPNKVCKVDASGFSLQNVTGEAKSRVILVSSTGAPAVKLEEILNEYNTPDGPPEGKKYLDYFKPDPRNAAYGSQIDIFAPGRKVFGAISGNADWKTCERKTTSNSRNLIESRNVSYPAPYKNTNKRVNSACYASGNGNSFAAPFVTGAAAFVWSINPDLTGDQVKKILVNSTDRYIEHLPKVNGRLAKYPMLNVAKAVETAIKLRDTTRIPPDDAPEAKFIILVTENTDSSRPLKYLEAVRVGETITFDASPSSDAWWPQSDLSYRWDFNGDSVPDTEWIKGNPVTQYTFDTFGAYNTILSVRNPLGNVDTSKQEVFVEPQLVNGYYVWIYPLVMEKSEAIIKRRVLLQNGYPAIIFDAQEKENGSTDDALLFVGPEPTKEDAIALEREITNKLGYKGTSVWNTYRAGV